MTDYDNFHDGQLKHLDLIQAVVGRLAGNSFLVKGWAITVAGAFAGFALNAREGWLALVGVLTTSFFWGMDTHFLRSERLFRALYDQVRLSDPAVTPFYLGATSKTFAGRVSEGHTRADRTTASWWRTAASPTLALFYGCLAGAGLLVAFMAWSLPAKDPDTAGPASVVLTSLAHSTRDVL